MPRYTLIWFQQKRNRFSSDFSGYLRRHSLLDELYYKIVKHAEHDNGVALRLDIDKVIILANNLDKDFHLNLLKELESVESFDVNMVSIVHENPAYVLLLASKLMPTKFYFQEYYSSPGKYHVAVIRLDNYEERIDLIKYIVHLRKDTTEIAFALSNLGNIALVYDYDVIALLNKDALEYLNAMDHVHIGIGIDIFGLKALNKAYDALRIAIESNKNVVILE